MLACARIAGLDQGTGGSDSTSRGTGSQDTPEGATIRPSQMTLTGGCGAQTDSDPITVENGSAESLPYSIESSDPNLVGVLDASGNIVAKVTGEVPAGRISTGVKVRVTAPDPGKHPATVIVTVGDTQRVVAVDLTVQGGTIAVASPFDFGEIRQQTTSVQNIAVTNSGTTTVSIDRWEGPNDNFTIVGGTLVLEPGQQKTVEARMNAGDIGPAVTATLTPHTLENLCGAVPKLELRGHRVSTDVTVTGTVTFGDVVCGSSAAQPIMITNYAQVTADYRINFAGDSYFTADQPTGTIPAAPGANTPVTRTVNLQLKPQNVPGDSHPETIPVEIVSNSTTLPKNINATARIRGALLDVQPSTLAFDAGNKTRQYTIRNQGNQFVYLAFSATNGFTAKNLFGADKAGLNGGSTMFMNATSPGGQVSGEASTTRIETPVLDFFSPQSGTLCAPAAKVTLTSQ